MAESTGTPAPASKRDPFEQAMDKFAKRIIAGVFAPLDLAKPEFLSGLITTSIAFILLLTGIIAAPPIRVIIAAHILHVNCLSDAEKGLGKEYCDFAVIGFQVLIAFIIGGVFITDRISAFVQRSALSYQRNRQEALLKRQRRLIRDVYRAYVAAKRSGNITMWKSPRKYFALWSYVYRPFSDNRIPKFYFFMLVFRFGSAFPKGFYGLLALLVFEGFLVAQITKGYFDYLPTCS